MTGASGRLAARECLVWLMGAVHLGARRARGRGGGAQEAGEAGAQPCRQAAVVAVCRLLGSQLLLAQAQQLLRTPRPLSQLSTADATPPVRCSATWLLHTPLHCPPTGVHDAPTHVLCISCFLLQLCPADCSLVSARHDTSVAPPAHPLAMHQHSNSWLPKAVQHLLPSSPDSEMCVASQLRRTTHHV